MTQQIGSLLGFLVFAALVDRIGRRPTFLIYLAIGAVSVAAFVLVAAPSVLYFAIFWTGFGITGLFAGLGAVHRRTCAELTFTRARHGHRL